MPSGSIEYNLPPNLWYTFDGRPLRAVEVQESGEKAQHHLLRPSRHTMSGGL